MILTDDDIRKLTKVRRLNLINSVTGIKPANLIGTVANDGRTNLAIFSSVVHLGSNPALVGFVMRPTSGEPRHTYENIKANGFYTINHVRESFVEKAHYTSAKFPREMSEFAVCRLTEEYVEGFKAPFVKESRVKFGLKFEQEIPIELNGTIFMIGSVRLLIAPDEIVADAGEMNLAAAGGVGISGLDGYYRLEKFAEFPYARPEDLPDFEG